MKKNILIIAIFALLAFVSSCTEKEPANNSGRVVFYYDQIASQGLIADQATSLNITVDGKIVATTGTNIYWDGVPECGQNGSMTVKFELGANTTDNIYYSVKDQTNFEYWKGNVDVTADGCSKVKLQWSK